MKFTTEEDDFLKKGITKHGFGQWTAILRDLDFKFLRRKNGGLSKEKGWNENAARLTAEGHILAKNRLHDINNMLFLADLLLLSLSCVVVKVKPSNSH